jgi:hypothetical protein
VEYEEEVGKHGDKVKTRKSKCNQGTSHSLKKH